MADASTRRRWLVLGSLLVLTAAACVFPVDEPAPRLPKAARPVRAAAAAPRIDDASPSLPVDVDPFSARGWQPEPVAPAAPALVKAIEPMVGPMPPPPPPPPPPLPFQFMGRLNDGASSVVYLSHGDQTVIARAGDTLESRYKVVSLSAAQIEFLYLPSGEKQLMSLPAPGN